ncbi:hypothetical protein FQA39_LY01690 [Lamprigera yunnana]|nr:hypothetical protein FQA39_LY01690 [Lamprigera yunnana]
MMFSIIDYALFVGMLVLSVLIGIYFGFCGKKQTADEYLLGSRSMGVLPVALSIIATQVSGITLLAVPSDVYLYGANYTWICVVIIPICITTCYVYLPVLIKLKTPSVFEYLNLRFGKTIKLIASLLFVLEVLIYNPIVAFVPAIALAQATGINVHFITPVIGIICIFYTTIGGFKAVVWTDTLQFIGVVGSVLAVFFLGISSVGGFGIVWNRAREGERLDILNFSLDPTIRDGFWPIVMGGTIHWLNNVCIYPPVVQKYLSVAKLGKARRIVLILCIGLITLKMFSVLTGILIYSKYYKCDPITTGEVTRNDQILPFFVMDVLSDIPGLSGIFIAGIFAAALSTLSSTFNSLSATIYEDFIKPYVRKEFSENRAKIILQLIVVISGILCITLTLLIDKMGTILPITVAFLGLIHGYFLALFTLGMLCPIANSKGALCGMIVSFITATTIAILNQWYKTQGVVETFRRPLSVDNCSVPLNVTVPPEISIDDVPFILFRLSAWYNSVIGFVVLMVIGIVVSCFTKSGEKVDAALLSPIVTYLRTSPEYKEKPNAIL